MALGIKCKLYYRSEGSYGSPTWSEISLIENLQVNPTWDEGQADDRSDRVHRVVKTMLGLEITGNLKKKPGNAAYEAVMNALVSDEALDILVMDGDINTVDNRGWRFDAQVFSANEDQGLGVGAVMEAISIKPTDSDNTCKAVLVGPGPALTYATPGGASASFS